LLLLPGAGSEGQRLLPLLWNLLGVAGAAWLWGWTLVRSGLAERGRVWIGVLLAALGPLAVNIAGAGFTGMEHALHGFASLAILAGLIETGRRGQVPRWLMAAILVAPLLRFEGLALALTAAVWLALTGYRRASALAVALALAPALLFAAFLVTLGLDPLPSSVMVKFADSGGTLGRLAASWATTEGKAIALLAAMLAGLGLWSGHERARRLLALGLAASGAAHLIFGQIGWMHRYEHYVFMTLAAGAIYCGARRWRGLPLAAVAVVLAVVGENHAERMWHLAKRAPRAIHFQQAQMARIAQEVLQEPVAVNDIGRVAWGNPHHVLDLWGLASGEARRLRVGGSPPGWADALVREAGVRVAMIYDDWLGHAIGPDWVRVANLRTLEPGVLGAQEVAIYAADPLFAPELRARLSEFAADLPADGAQIVLLPEEE
jgi:hypothetical protein